MDNIKIETNNQQLNGIQAVIDSKEQELYQWMKTTADEFDGNTPLSFGHNLGFMVHVSEEVIGISFANNNTASYMGVGRNEFKEILSQSKAKVLDLLSKMDIEQDLVEKVGLSTATLDSLESHQERFLAFIANDPKHVSNENLGQVVKVLYYGAMDLASTVGNIYAKMAMNNPTTKVTLLK